MLRIHITVQLHQKGRVRNQFFWKFCGIKREIQIHNAVGAVIMNDGRDSSDIHLFIPVRQRLPGDIRKLQKRNLHKFFLGGRRLLKFFQLSGLLGEIIKLFLIQGSLNVSQLTF